MRLSVIMVRIWNNWIPLMDHFAKPTVSVRPEQSTNVRVLLLREPELREALRVAIASQRSDQLADLQRLCAALAAGDAALQAAVYQSRRLIDSVTDITDLLLTTGSAGQQAIAAGPSAVIRHMCYALLCALRCFSAAIAGGDTDTTAACGTPWPATAPPPPPPAVSAAPPQCQLLSLANSDEAILDGLDVLMKDMFDVGLTFFHTFLPDPVFASGPLPESRSAAAQAPVSSQMIWRMGAVRSSAQRYMLSLEVVERYVGKLERLWSLISAGAGSSPLGKAESDHNLTDAVMALTAGFVQHVPGYTLEQTLEAKATDSETPEIPPLEPRKVSGGWRCF